MSKSASKIRDVRSSVQREMAFFKNRRSVSVDTRSRGSYVPDKKRPSSEERNSGNKPFNSRWGSARKSSINLAEVKRKDTRPLSDKAYQKRKINDLVEFLNEVGFAPSISKSKLMSPSKKDFENIFQFLYNFFDPVYKVQKIEEEGPKILKNLGYPFSVNKSAYLYVARTNWPSLLGVLLWLMDLNKFAMKMDMKSLFENEDDGSPQVHKIFLQYILQCYHSGIDNEEQENAVFVKIITSSMSENLDELIPENEQKHLLVESVEKKINEIESLAEQEIILKKNIEKYEDYILKMKSHYEKRKGLCKELMEDLKQKESELKALSEEVSKKQDAYDAQGFDGRKHLTYFECQKEELAEILDKKRAVLKKLQDKVWETEIEYKRNHDQIMEAAESSRELYNSTIEGTKSLLEPLLNINNPQLQKLCSNFHFDFPFWKISLNKCDAKSSKAYGSALEEIIDKIKGTEEILKTICASLNQKLNEIEMKKSELTTQLKLLSIQETKIEKDLTSKKKQDNDEISALEVQCEKTDQAVRTLQSEKSELEKVHNEMCGELNTLKEFLESKTKELKEYLIQQEEMFEYFAKNEQLAVQKVEEYGNEIAAKLEELEKIYMETKKG